MAHHVHKIPGNLYRPAEVIPDDIPRIRGYNFNQGVDYTALLRSYLTTGLQATNVGLAIQQINNMVRQVAHTEKVLLMALVPFVAAK